MPNVKIYPDQHKTFLSSQAMEFRNAYKISNSKTVPRRNGQKNLIVEEFKEFLEAEGSLFRNSPSIRSEALKELADLVYVCYQYAANMNWDLDEAMHRVHAVSYTHLRAHET